LYRGNFDFKKGYQPRNSMVKDEKSDLVTDCHSNLSRCRKHFFQLFIVHGVSDVRQTEIHMAELLAPEPSSLEAEMAVEKIKGHKPRGIGQIPTEVIKTGGRKIRNEIHKLIKSIWKKEELPEEWKESIITPVYKEGDNTYFSIYRGISLFLSVTYKMLSITLLSRLTTYAKKLLRLIIVDFDATVQLQIKYSTLVKYLRKSGNEMKQCFSYL
jgi:hypothetical protein